MIYRLRFNQFINYRPFDTTDLNKKYLLLIIPTTKKNHCMNPTNFIALPKTKLSKLNNRQALKLITDMHQQVCLSTQKMKRERERNGTGVLSLSGIAKQARVS